MILADTGDGNVFVGPAGWSYDDWKGIVYPSRKPRGFDPLEYIASYFDLVEVNSTFYRVPAVETCRRWSERVCGNPRFRFTAKVYRDFTHGRRRPSPAEVNDFKSAVAPMYEAGRLGALLVQFPWSFRHDAEGCAYVTWLSGLLAPFPVAIEVRHGGWGSPEALTFFRDSGLTMCAIDQPLIGDSLGAMSHNAGDAGCYFRLHGRNRANWFNERAGRDERYDYHYSARELDEWVPRIIEARDTARTVHVVLNNHFRGQAIANGLELVAKLEKRVVAAPPGIIAAYPRSASQLDARPEPEDPPDEQRSLFD